MSNATRPKPRKIMPMDDLSVTELRQLLEYARVREDEGWYYGNKKHFEERHRHIVQVLLERTELSENQ